jgi:hypothetical protein
LRAKAARSPVAIHRSPPPYAPVLQSMPGSYSSASYVATPGRTTLWLASALPLSSIPPDTSTWPVGRSTAQAWARRFVPTSPTCGAVSLQAESTPARIT